MRFIRKIAFTGLLWSGILLVLQVKSANADVRIVSYTCVPSDCTLLASDTDYFSVTVSISGGLYNDSGDWYPNPRTKGVSQSLSSLGCTALTNLTVLGYPTESPIFGGGFTAYVKADQGGPDLIEITNAVFWASSSRVGPSAVPCI